KENIFQPENQTVALCHGEDLESLTFVKTMVEDAFHPKSFLISTVGCAIGAHTGRGIIGFCYFDADNGKYAKYFTP
ncbi:MAG: DegV family protein, partial [Lachnospiraceae bacterium]|nr:DegV family protein [Lachnospiraceae bacterium]